MFSGIIENVGVICNTKKDNENMVITVSTNFSDIEIGESIAINGVCLTVTDYHEGKINFYISKETLNLTNLATLNINDKVNTERAISLNTRLSGHIVQGHVDSIGEIIEITPQGESYFIRIALPNILKKYMVKKGSIAINGISLTINDIDHITAQNKEVFSLSFMIIPHTWNNTCLSSLKVGSKVNIETDMIAKHIEKLIEHKPENFSSFFNNFIEKNND